MGNVAYSAKIWASIKTIYESHGESLKKVQAMCKKMHGNAPSMSRIEKKAIKECWKRGKHKAKIEIKTQEALEDLFVRLGLPREERVRVLINGVTEPTKLIFEGPPDEEGKPTQKICTPVPDYDVRLRYLKEIHDLLGERAPKKMDHTSKGKQISGSQPALATMTIEDLNGMIAERAAAINANDGSDS